MPSRTIRAGLVAGGAALVVCGALLIPLQQAGSADSGAEATEGTPAPASREVAQMLGVLSRPQRSDDRVRVEPGTIGAVDPQPGENIGESRRAAFADGVVHVWPKANGACFSTRGVSSCAEAEDLAEQEVLLALYRGAAVRDGVVRLAGVAVEGVESLDVGLSDGRAVELPVRDNMFLADLDAAPVEVRWKGPSGPRSEKLPRG